MYSLVRAFKTNSKEVEGGGCMRGRDGELLRREVKFGIVASM